jgi:hypothetical protein
VEDVVVLVGVGVVDRVGCVVGVEVGVGVDDRVVCVVVVVVVVGGVNWIGINCGRVDCVCGDCACSCVGGGIVGGGTGGVERSTCVGRRVVVEEIGMAYDGLWVN